MPYALLSATSLNPPTIGAQHKTLFLIIPYHISPTYSLLKGLFPWRFVFTLPRHLMCSFTFCQSQVVSFSRLERPLPKRWAVRASWQAWAQRIKACPLLGEECAVFTPEIMGEPGGEAFSICLLVIFVGAQLN